jgi:hypothetical protein
LAGALNMSHAPLAFDTLTVHVVTALGLSQKATTEKGTH